MVSFFLVWVHKPRTNLRMWSFVRDRCMVCSCWWFLPRGVSCRTLIFASESTLVYDQFASYRAFFYIFPSIYTKKSCKNARICYFFAYFCYIIVFLPKNDDKVPFCVFSGCASIVWDSWCASAVMGRRECSSVRPIEGPRGLYTRRITTKKGATESIWSRGCDESFKEEVKT